jgi:TonB-like protein
MHFSVAVTVTLACLLVACASAPGERPESDRQAELVGAPEVATIELCEELVVKSGLLETPPAAARASARGWVILAYSLDGSGDAKNITVFQSSAPNEFIQSSISALRSTKFVTGASRQTCKFRTTYSVQVYRDPSQVPR